MFEDYCADGEKKVNDAQKKHKIPCLPTGVASRISSSPAPALYFQQTIGAAWNSLRKFQVVS